MTSTRFNRRTLRVVRLLDLVAPKALDGYQISQITGVGPATVYPILARLEMDGTVTATKGRGDPAPVLYARTLPIGRRS